MKFAPRSKEDLDSMNLLKPGSYHFRVANAKDKISKSGNEMIELTLEVFDDLGHGHTVFDYLLEAMPQKLYAFCMSTKMEHQYNQGTLKTHDCIDKSAYVEIIIQKGGDNPQGGSYPDKNSVKYYISKPETVESSSHSFAVAPKSYGKSDFVDSDIPF